MSNRGTVWFRFFSIILLLYIPQILPLKLKRGKTSFQLRDLGYTSVKHTHGAQTPPLALCHMWCHTGTAGVHLLSLLQNVQLTQKVEIQQATSPQGSSSKEVVLVLVVAVLFTVSTCSSCFQYYFLIYFNSDKLLLRRRWPHDMFRVCESLM